MAPEPHDPSTEEPPRTPASEAEELLVDGQEEVFARAEVERGAIEHHSLEEDQPRPTPVDPDEAMADNFRASFNPRP